MRDGLGVLDLVVLVVLAVAAVVGWRRSGRGQGCGSLGRLVGALLGLVLGSGPAQQLSLLGTSRGVRLVLLLVGVLVAVAVGAWLGGLLGSLAGRVVARARLGVADRAVGAAAGLGSAVLVVVVVLAGFTLLGPLGVGAGPAAGSTVLQGIGELLPRTSATVTDLTRAAGLR